MVIQGGWVFLMSEVTLCEVVFPCSFRSSGVLPLMLCLQVVLRGPVLGRVRSGRKGLLRPYLRSTLSCFHGHFDRVAFSRVELERLVTCFPGCSARMSAGASCKSSCECRLNRSRHDLGSRAATWAIILGGGNFGDPFKANPKHACEVQ